MRGESAGRAVTRGGDLLTGRIHLDFVDGDFVLAKLLHHSLLLSGRDHKQCFPYAGIPCRSASPVCVSCSVLRTIQLQHPVNFWEVKTSGSNVRCQQNRSVLGTKLIIDGTVMVLLTEHHTRQ